VEVSNNKNEITECFNLEYLSASAFLWRGFWYSSHIEFWDYTNIYMENFIGSSRGSEQGAEKDVEHVDKNQWNGREYTKMGKKERRNGNAI
jgi:hypothetical protein